MPAPSIDDLIAAKRAVARRAVAPRLLAGGAARAGGLLLARRLSDAVALAAVNVHAVGVGAKRVAGKSTGDLCVRFYVSRKLPDSLLAPALRVPAAIDGIPTDVIQSPQASLMAGPRRRRPAGGKRAGGGPPAIAGGPAELTSALAVDALPPFPSHDCGSDRQGKQRPVYAGISVANADLYGGTIGYFCRSILPGEGGLRLLLSNHHVLGEPWEPGTPQPIVLQPGRMYNGSTGDSAVGTFVRGTLDPNGGPSAIDAAVALLGPGIEPDLARGVCGVGPVNPVAPDPNPPPLPAGVLVRKHGANSGMTYGRVVDLSHDPTVSTGVSNPSTIMLIDQIGIEPLAAGGPAFALPGDSGALVLDAGGPTPLGLLCGGDAVYGQWAIATPIAATLAALHVELL